MNRLCTVVQIICQDVRTDRECNMSVRGDRTADHIINYTDYHQKPASSKLNHRSEHEDIRKNKYIYVQCMHIYILFSDSKNLVTKSSLPQGRLVSIIIIIIILIIIKYL